MPIDPKKAMAEAYAAFHAGRSEHAETLLKEVRKAYPHDPQPVLALAMVANKTTGPHAALPLMKAALALQPRSAQTLLWIAILSQQVDDRDAAYEYSVRATQADPKSAEALYLAGECSLQRESYQEALGFFTAAVAINSAEPTFHRGRSNALSGLSRDGEALEAAKEATKLLPNEEYLTIQGELEHLVGNVADSVKTNRRALRQNPELVRAQTNLARALTEMGDPDAEEAWDRAVALAPDSGDLRLHKARALAARGERDAAIEELLRVIELSPTLGFAYYSLVATQVATPNLVERMEAALQDGATAARDAVMFEYALGKAYEDLGDFETAMRHYDKANLLKRRTEMQGRPLDREGLTEFVDAQIALFTKGSLQHYQQRGIESDLPVLVVGMMRTGTTLAEQILSCHPQIGGAGEQSYWGDRQPQLLDVQARRMDQLFLRSAATKYVELLQGLAPGFPRVIDKNPANVLLLGLIHSALPNCRTIHMLRNPIDTALSIWMTPMRTTAPFVSDRSDIVFAFTEYLRLAEHFRQVLPEDRFTEMRYEELTSNPEPSIRQLIAFLGLEWSEACLRPEENPRAVRTPSVWQVRQPIHSLSQERRRHYAPWLGEFEELERAAEQ